MNLMTGRGMLRALLILLAVTLFPAGVVTAAQDDLLEPEKAFAFSARTAGPDSIEVRYVIAPGYYLYRDKFRFVLDPADAVAGPPVIPPGKIKKDEFFGETAVFREQVVVRIPVRPGLQQAVLTATSQGCADVGVCYVPVEQKASLQWVSAAGPAPDPDAPPGLFQRRPSATGAEPPAAGEDSLIAELFGGSAWWLLLSFFGFGLLLSFTPCVLPMVPILSGIIIGKGVRLTRGHAFSLSLAYVIGMALTYAIAGAAAGLSGALLSSALQNPWVLGTFSALFVLLAGSMFGLYELQLPTAWQSRLADVSGHMHGGHYAGVFVMGALSALIVGPCVAAPLAGALLYISRSGDVLLGGAALFVMGLGMGVPLLAVGLSAGTLLPKAGAWMETVKRFFGVMLLAVAIYLVSPVIPVTAQMLAWAALLIGTGIFLRALDGLPPHATGFPRFTKAVGVVALVAGVAYLIGALSGARDVLQPLAGLRASAAVENATVSTSFRRVSSVAELDAAVREAAGKTVMLDFYADWCVSCKQMERYTFTDPAVRQRLDRLVKLQADVTANTADHKALLTRFRLFGPPGIVFFDSKGREIPGLRVIGFQSAGKFAAVLDQALGER